jgi:hypothetical protein
MIDLILGLVAIVVVGELIAHGIMALCTSSYIVSRWMRRFRKG